MSGESIATQLKNECAVVVIVMCLHVAASVACCWQCSLCFVCCWHNSKLIPTGTNASNNNNETSTSSWWITLATVKCATTIWFGSFCSKAQQLYDVFLSSF